MHGGERPGEGHVLGRGMSWRGERPWEEHALGEGHGRRGGLFCGVMSRTYKNPSLLQSYINIAFFPLLSWFPGSKDVMLLAWQNVVGSSSYGAGRWCVWCKYVNVFTLQCVHTVSWKVLCLFDDCTIFRSDEAYHHAYANSTGCTYTEVISIRTKADPALILGVMHRKVMLCVLGTNEY